MKIVSTGATISSPEFYRKKLKARRQRLIIFSAILLSLLFAIVLVSRIEKLRISKVTVVGADVIGEDVVSKTALGALSGNYLWLIPKNNSLIYSRSAVRDGLESSFPRFSSIELSLEDSQTLNISVSEREPYALYCASASGDEVLSSCYFLDEKGYVFDKAPAFSQGVYFIYASNPAIEAPLGFEFLTPDAFAQLSVFIKNLPQLGLEPTSLTMSQTEFAIALANGGILRWSRESDLSLLHSNLESFFKDETIAAQPDFIGKLKELDLRTENKVFYSFNQE